MQKDNAAALLSAEQAAQYLNLSTSTLAKMRLRGDCPAYVKLGGHAVRYRRADLESFVDTNIRRSTSEAPEAA